MKITLGNLEFNGKKVSVTKVPKIKKGEWRVSQVANKLVFSQPQNRNSYVAEGNDFYMIKLW